MSKLHSCPQPPANKDVAVSWLHSPIGRGHPSPQLHRVAPWPHGQAGSERYPRSLISRRAPLFALIPIDTLGTDNSDMPVKGAAMLQNKQNATRF